MEQLKTAPPLRVAETSDASGPRLTIGPIGSLSRTEHGQDNEDGLANTPASVEHDHGKVLSLHLTDLRSVCAEEFSKASGQLSENVKKWALEVCAAEIAPRQHELRAEIDVARAGFAGQVRDLMHRLDDVGTAQILIGQRVDALEDQHHQDSWKVEQISEEFHGILKGEASELKDKLSTLETRYVGFEHRLDGVETQ